MSGEEGEARTVTDRAGRAWRYGNYATPSGPAFWLELPGELCPPGTGSYAAHFDGTLDVRTP